MFNYFAHAGHEHADSDKNETVTVQTTQPTDQTVSFSPMPIMVGGISAILVGTVVFVIAYRSLGSKSRNK